MENKSRLGWWIGLVFLSLFALIALIPTVASTQWGIKQLSKLVTGTITVKKAHLSWFSRQSVEGFSYQGPEAVFSFEHFSTDSSLATLLLTQRAADTKLISPKLTLETSQIAKQEKTHTAFFLPFKGGVDIQNGYLAIKKNHTIAAEFQAIEVHLNIDENALPITLTASGKTTSGPTVGNFNITGQIASEKTNSEFSQWITKKLGLPKSTPLNYTLDVNLRNFPLTGALNAAIGPTLTLQTELHAGESENTLSLSAHSQHLNANISAKAPASSLLIASGSTANWQITPPFWQTFGTDLRLLQPVQANFRAESIEIPIGNWNQTKGQATATFSDGVITPSDKNASVTISHTTIQLNTQNLKQALDVAISSAPNDGLLTANFTYPQPLEGAPTIYALLTKLKAKATNFPTALFGLSDYLGEALNFAIESDNDILDISASSNLLNARMLEFKITPQALQLTKPADIRYTLKSAYLTSETPINISLSQLYLPSLWQQMRLQGQLSASQATLKPLGSYGQIQLIDSNLSINAKTLHDASFTFLSRMGFTGQTGLFKELLGPALRLSGQGKADLTKHSIPALKLTATGKTSELQIDAALHDQTLILKKPIKLQTILTKKAFNLLKPEALSNLMLIQDAPISFALDPFKLKLPELTWQSTLAANFKAPTLQLKSTQPFTITNLDTGVSQSTETTAIETRGHIQDGAFDISLNLNNADNTIQKADIAFTSFSTAVLDNLLGPEQSLSNTFGSTFDLNLDIDPKRYKIHLTSPNLSIAGAFKIDAHNYINSTNTPLTITYLLTPEAYRNYHKTAQFTLASPAKIRLNIQELKAPLKSKPTLKAPIPSINWDLSQILINLKARSDELTFAQNKLQTSLNNLDLHLDKSSLASPLTFNLDAALSMQKNAKARPQSGSIQLAGNLTDYYDQNGHFSTQNLSTDLSGQIKQMPTLLLDALIPDSAALFGDYLNATLAAQIHNMNGTLTCAVTSPHTTFKLDSYLSNGILHLRAPLDAAFTLTPALSNLFLKDAKLVALSAEKPIHLYIDPQNVSIPMRNFNWQNVRLGRARLDFGKIIVASQGSAADLIEIFKIRRPNQVTLWFAPMDFSIKSGKMDIQRTEILYDAAYQIAIWGRINFPRRYVDMTLGLTAQSLQRALNLQLPPSYVLTVGIEGPFGNVHINKGDAIAKIALIIADQSGLAPRQGIAGGVFGLIQGLAHDQSNVPPPRPPFPWSN